MLPPLPSGPGLLICDPSGKFSSVVVTASHAQPPTPVHLSGGIFAQRGGGMDWDGVTVLDTRGCATQIPPSGLKDSLPQLLGRLLALSSLWELPSAEKHCLPGS